jgi:hypothetical protein
MALRQSGALDQEKKVSEVLQPLADVGSNLPTYRPGVPDSPDVARQRTAFQGGILSRGLESQPAMLAQLGVQMGQGTAKRREEIASLGRQAAKEAGAAGLELKDLNAQVRTTRKALGQAGREFGVNSPEFAEALETYRTFEQRRNKAATRGGRTISVSPDGAVEISEGEGTQSIRMDLRAIDSINALDSLLSDIDWTMDVMANDPNLTGFTGGLQNLFNTTAGIVSDLAMSDIAAGNIVDPGYAAKLQRDITGDGEIQGLKLMEMRFAYAWVRANRGNGRVTQKELESAMDRFKLVGGARASKQVMDTMRMFRRMVARDQRQTRSKFKDVLKLDLPDTAFEPLPDAPAPTTTRPPRRGRPEFEALVEEMGLGGGP